MLYALLTVYQRVKERSANADCGYAKSDGFQDVGSTLETPVDENLEVLECFGELFADFEEDEDRCLSAVTVCQ